MNRKINVVVLACYQAVPDASVLLNPLKTDGLGARLVLEPCSSKIEAYQLLRILATEADLVWVVGCTEDLCRLLEGSTRMGQRVAYAQKYLEEIGLEPERLGKSRLNPGDATAAAAIADEIKTRAQTLGPSKVLRK